MEFSLAIWWPICLLAIDEWKNLECFPIVLFFALQKDNSEVLYVIMKI